MSGGLWSVLEQSGIRVQRQVRSQQVTFGTHHWGTKRQQFFVVALGKGDNDRSSESRIKHGTIEASANKMEEDIHNVGSCHELDVQLRFHRVKDG